MLSDESKETIEWVKKAFGTNKSHPIDSNLYMSTDDTILFIFEGTTAGVSGEWAWKLIDKLNCELSVRSDFEVGEDDKMAGGLRVCLTFTFTASGLTAPPYVVLSGLTTNELSVDECPSGILATKIHGLCKGGNDICNDGIGWLVFLCADKKNSDANQATEHLSIANKKLVHYNNEVLLPFIRDIRKMLRWKEGQSVPDSLKACSWFDGDIGQLQTTMYKA